MLYQKITTYDLDYRDKQGHPKPVKFVSYIWKRIDGFILDSLKEELSADRVSSTFASVEECGILTAEEDER